MSALIVRNTIGTVGVAKGYVSVASSTAKSPYYVVSRVSGERDMALGGVTGGKSGMFQIDVYAKTYTEADSLVDQIINRSSSSGQFDVGGISELPDDYSSDTGDFRLSIELSVQF